MFKKFPSEKINVTKNALYDFPISIPSPDSLTLKRHNSFQNKCDRKKFEKSIILVLVRAPKELTWRGTF